MHHGQVNDGILPEEPDPACWYHGCGNPDAPHAVTWKCPAGHRMTLRYCEAHARRMAALAAQAAVDPGDGLGCARCPDPAALLRPVLEGVLPASFPSPLAQESR